MWSHLYVELKKQTKISVINTENKLLVARDMGLGGGQNGWRGSNVPNSSYNLNTISSVQFSLSHVWLFATPPTASGFPIHHQFLEPAQTHLHWVSDAIQPSYPLSSPFPPAFNLSQHQGIFQWVSSSHQMTKVLELQLQHQSFQWICRTDFL